MSPRGNAGLPVSPETIRAQAPRDDSVAQRRDEILVRGRNEVPAAAGRDGKIALLDLGRDEPAAGVRPRRQNSWRLDRNG